MREPIFAAWVVTLCPDQAAVEPHVPAILARFTTSGTSGCISRNSFPVESAYYRLRLSGMAHE